MTDMNKVEPPLFPTMLRKMWSGREVQEWINANWDASTLTALQSENESHTRARQYLLAENDTLRTQLAEARAENEKLKSSNESYITLANTAYEITSTLRTQLAEAQAENKRLREALTYLVECSVPLSSQQEQCWISIRAALKGVV